MTFISYRTKNMCMKIYSEYLYIIKFMNHLKMYVKWCGWQQ